MLRAVGIVFVVIFSGIIAESSALIGPNGLLPLPRLLEQARADHTGMLDTLLHRPSVFWINADPAMIAAVEWGGLLAAVALVLNPSAEVERVKGARGGCPGGIKTSGAGPCRDRLRQDAIQLRRS